MNDFVLDTSDIRVLLSHMALYGLGAMLDDAGIDDVRIGWTPGMQPRPRITGEALAAEHVDNIVRDHARARAHESSWVQRDIELAGKARGLMSPRLTPFAEQEVWTRVQVARHQELDALTTARAWPDLQLVAALGEPCYWSHNRQRVPLQDDGASRLEMQPRNQGSEFVGSRLRKLAVAVAARKPGSVAAGISGAAPIDEIGSDKVDSRTPTGFANPGPTDNALAWCALWGIAQLPSIPRIDRTVLTTGHIGRTRQEWFYVPVWETPLRPSRLRTILVSRQLREAAASGLSQPWGSDAAQDVRARSWLNARGVVGIVRFPIERFGSDSAPERRAMRGVTISLPAS
jgi:CRISPR-associated protein Csb3